MDLLIFVFVFYVIYPFGDYMPIKTHQQIAEPVTGYVLNPTRSYFSVLVPEATVNMVLDPHFETNANYGGSGTLTLQSDIQRRSRRAYKIVTPASGYGLCYTLGDVLDADNDYTFSLDLLGVGSYTLYFGSNTGTAVYSKVVQGRGLWDRPFISTYIRAANIQQVCIVSNSAATFYVDGFQLEQKPYPTTFCSGSLATSRGNSAADYAWLGAPNRAMSVRSASALDGGRIVPLSDLGFDVTSFLQLGFAEQTNMFEDFTLLPGSFYLGSRSGRRTFTLVGNIESDSIRGLLCKRFKIGSNLTGGDSVSTPIKLISQLYDDDMPVTEEVATTAIYKSGLEGNTDNLYQEKASIVFETGDTLFEETGVSASTMTLTTTMPTAQGIIGINGDGVVSETGVVCTSNQQYGMVIGPDNNMYIICGSRIIQYNGVSSTTIYTKPDGSAIFALGFGPDGQLYFSSRLGSFGGGQLFNMNLQTGVVSTYDNFITNPLGFVATIRSDGKNSLYIGGLFTTISNGTSGTVTARNIAKLHVVTGVMTPLGTGLGTDTAHTYYGVRDIVVDNQGLVWAGGNFSNGTDVNHDIHNLAVWDGVQWEPTGNFSLGSSVTITTIFNAKINKLAYDSTRNIICVAGKFDTFRTQQNVIVDYSVRNVAAIYQGDRDILTGVLNIPTSLYGIDSVTRLAGGLGYFGTHPSSIYEGEALDVSVACNGDIAIAGDFAYAQNILNDDIVVSPESGIQLSEAIPSPGVALWDSTNKRWKPVPFSMPSLSPFAQSFIVPAVTYGGKCGKGAAFSGSYVVGTNATSAPSDLIQPGSADSFFFDTHNLVGVTSLNVNIVNNGCAVSARPVIEVTGPGTLYSIKNLTTGKTIIVNGKYVFGGETVIIDTNIGTNGMFSSVSGDITNLIDRSSSFPDFSLQKGVNKILVKMLDTDGSTRVVLRWKRQYASIDALCDEGCLL